MFPKYGKPSTKHLMWLTFSTFELSGGFAAQYETRYVPSVERKRVEIKTEKHITRLEFSYSCGFISFVSH